MSVLTEKQFTEALPRSLDIFELEPYQTSILQHYYVNVRPLSALTDSSPVEFLIPGGGSDYVDLSKSRLIVRLRVTHADKTVLSDKEHVAPVNLLLQSLWSQVSVYFQGQQVSSSNGGYPYKAMMTALLEQGPDAKNSQLQSQLFYPDSGASSVDLDSTDPFGGGNDGLINRAGFIADSKVLTLSGPILEDVFNLSRKLVNGIEIGIKLFRSPTPFVLMSGVKDQQYTIELQDVYLKVCKLRVNNALILAHNQQFEKSNALYPHMKTEVKMVSVPASQLTYTWDNMYLDHCPSRLVVGVVSAEGVSGSYTANPFNFQGQQIKSVSLFHDGVEVPGRGLVADEIEAYVNLFMWNDLWRADKGLGIQRDEFTLGNALFVFNLEGMTSDDDYLNLLKSGSLRLEVQFKSALTSTLNIIVMSQSPALLEVDKSRNVFVK